MTNDTTSTTPLNILIGVQFVEAVLIIFANSLALAAFLSKTFRVKKSTYFLINLTVADLMVGTSVIFLSVYHASSIKAGAYNRASNAFRFVALNASLCSFTAISVERAYAVLAPFRHRLLGKKPYIIGIAMTWVYAFVSASRQILQLSSKMLLAVLINLALFILGVLVVCYLTICIKVKFFTPLPSRRQNSNAKLTVTLFLMTFVSLLCFLPSVAIASHEILINNGDDNKLDIHFAWPILYINSFINVLVYSFRMEDFKRELHRKVRACYSSCMRGETTQEVVPKYLQTSKLRGEPILTMMHREGREQPSLIMINTAPSARNDIPSCMYSTERAEADPQQLR
ncbi:sphingosine 1-phosphate receptor 3 [Nematostella vectensis]|uniref:sphingosine 1-phosphate receptor 3 n=1 Tax=Nematostella vectensis TaxID=45351 RepID=UPI002076F29E|nr:sphingosine 1-phosphate receptor 3 [Nematostella vectensis]